MFVVPFRDEEEQRHQMPAVVEHVRDGGLLLYPTETVYGLGGQASAAAVERLAALKGRAAAQSFLLLVARPDAVEGVEWTDCARRLADAFWPGALTLVLPSHEGAFPPGVRSADGGVAVRQSPHPVVARLLDALGEPITSTSANLTGEPPARSAQEALSLLKRLSAEDTEVWMLNGGDAPGGTPSTVVDCRGEPRVLREGAVDVQLLRSVIEEIRPG